MFLTQSKEDMMRRLKARLRAEGFDDSDSSIVTLFSSILAEELQLMSQELRQVYQDNHLSTATEEGLQRKGQDRKLPRQPGEELENYRYRLVNQENAKIVHSPTGIEQSLLQRDDVKLAQLIPFTHGPGSGTIFVVPHDPFVEAGRFKDMLYSDLKRNGVLLDSIHYEIKLPINHLLRMRLQLLFRPNTSTEQRRERYRQVRTLIEEYVSDVLPGETLFIEPLRGMILRFEEITDVDIADVQLNGSSVAVGNLELPDYTRIVLDTSPEGIVFL